MALISNQLYLHRGGIKIAIEKEEEVFTFIPTRDEDISLVEALNGALVVSPISNGIFKVHADAETVDAAMDKIRNYPTQTVCHHAYRPLKTEGTRYYIQDSINVKFTAGTAKISIEKILDKYGLAILREYEHLSGTYLLRVMGSSGVNPVKLSNIIADAPEIEFAEPNLVERNQPAYVPQDSLFGRQWHLRSWNGPHAELGADVDATTAWDITRGDPGVVVAIIDDGVDLNHPDFRRNGKVVYPKDYIDGDSNPFPTATANNYHGTPCAGVAVADENGCGVVGIAPKCSLLPIRFSLNAGDNMLVDIFTYAARYADVISCSWGPVPAYAPLSSVVSSTIQYVSRYGGSRGNGSLICFAAGNYNAPINDPKNTGFKWRHPTLGVRKVVGPILNGWAAHSDIVTVSACTSQKRKAAYSNWGKEISITAPSNNFHPLSPQTFVPGLGIWTTDNERFGSGFTRHSIYTGDFGGTSSATPLVAGIAALVRSANPNLSALDIKALLESSTDKIVDRKPDTVLKLKKGTYNSSGHSGWFGYGKIDAAKAVAIANLTAISFFNDILPLFRPKDIESMRAITGLNLSNYRDVLNNRKHILEELKTGRMPCDGAWPKEEVEKFERWVDTGAAP